MSALKLADTPCTDGHQLNPEDFPRDPQLFSRQNHARKDLRHTGRPPSPSRPFRSARRNSSCTFGTAAPLIIVSLEPMRGWSVTKLDRMSLRAPETSGHHNCAQKESGSLRSRSQSPSTGWLAFTAQAVPFILLF